MRHTILSLILLVCAVLVPCLASAQDRCASLTPAQRKVADEAMATSYLYDCCDDTIKACLAAGKCSLAKRLADEACRYAAAGKSAKDIKHIFEQRAEVMAGTTPPVKIEMTPEHVWGNPQAKVVLSVYVCARCPYCSRHVPALIDALETWPHRDKVAINLRLFPIKSHDNSTPAALAVEAAARMGKAWDYLLVNYRHFDEFSLQAIPGFGAETGLDAAQFEQLRRDAGVRASVVASKKEGFVNHVETTPTTFLNGRKLQGVFDVEAILSMLEESLEKAGEI